MGKHLADFTEIDLLNNEYYNLEYIQDGWGFLRPIFCADKIALSAEMLLSASTFRMEQWAQSGWKDFTFQVEHKVYTIENNLFLADEMEKIKRETLKVLEKAKTQARQTGMMTELIGTARQRDGSDTGKAVLMSKKIEDNQYIIAVSFMGTGGRFYDWLSNLRFDSEKGIHRGFIQLTEQFMSHSDTIYFPAIAQDLQVESLTLTDIIKEAGKSNSRFRFWVTGHSQGAAMMQLWIYLLANRHKVRLSNMDGYGFASPLVMMGEVGKTPGKYPIYHILSNEDFVRVVGGQIRLGVDVFFPLSEKIKEKAFGWDQSEKSKENRRTIKNWFEKAVDMPTALELMMAFFKVLMEENPEKIDNLLEKMGVPFANLKVVEYLLENRAQALYRFIYRRVEKAYKSLTQVGFCEKKMNQIAKELIEITREIPLEQIMDILMEMAYWPHILQPSEETKTSAYLELVKNMPDYIYLSIWERGNPPMRKWNVKKRRRRK